MALPRKLKLMNFLADGNSYRGQVTEITQPKLAIKLEEYRAGGMFGPVKVNLGVEGLEAQFKMGGYMTELIKNLAEKLTVRHYVLREPINKTIPKKWFQSN